jgi:dipeptidyl aminopeptidase/acylaminoacyl peptidase
MMCLVLALQVALAAPQPIAELDTGRLKGDVAQLAWSPDGSEFYVMTVERDRSGAITGAKHYVLSIAGKNVKSVDQEPAWALKYWAWKSGQTAPGAAAFKIDVSQREETLRATASPTGGSLAKGGNPNPGDATTFEDVANAANQAQKLLVSQLKVKDETLGTWVNEPVMPGYSFSWAPAPLHLLAFARRDKKDGGPIVVIDQNGQRQELGGARAAILPAWSDDGKRLAWLERKDKKKYQLMIADISVQ